MPTTHPLSHPLRQLESKFTSYTSTINRIKRRLDTETSNPSSFTVEDGTTSLSSTDQRDDKDAAVLETQIPSLLQSLAMIISQMTMIIQSTSSSASANTTNNTTNNLLIKRYRDIMVDYEREFKSASEGLLRKRQTVELFSGANKASSLEVLAGDDGDGNEEMSHLLRERSSLANTLSSSSSIINQAQASFQALRNQRASLAGSQSGVSNISGLAPSIGRVIERIRRKRGRDNLVLGGVISGCILFTLWYWIG